MQVNRQLERLIVPWGKQEIILQEVIAEAGGMPLLRVRIREGSRFTIFDLDCQSARQIGQAMRDWGAQVEQGEAEKTAGVLADKVPL